MGESWNQLIFVGISREINYIIYFYLFFIKLLLFHISIYFRFVLNFITIYLKKIVKEAIKLITRVAGELG
jgi:hypothetical protein